MSDTFGDQIRKLLVSGGASQDNAAKAARATADVMDFRKIAGDPTPGQEMNYGHALGSFLKDRGHTVNYT
jgi:hypothetical protein